MRGKKAYGRRLGKVMISGKSPMDTFPIIEIGKSELVKIDTPHDDPLVIKVKISNLRVRRIFAHLGSSSDMISLERLNHLTHDPKAIEKIYYPIICFGVSIIHPIGVISLPLRLGGRSQGRKLNVEFLVVEDLRTYNFILGHPL